MLNIPINFSACLFQVIPMEPNNQNVQFICYCKKGIMVWPYVNSKACCSMQKLFAQAPNRAWACAEYPYSLHSVPVSSDSNGTRQPKCTTYMPLQENNHDLAIRQLKSMFFNAEVIFYCLNRAWAC